MTDQRVSAIRDAARPPVADRAAFQSELDRLRVREKAHTREGDAIAAARRRLPMVEVDPQTPLTAADGPVPLIDLFDGRSQLIAYFHMWHTGRPAAEQCEGCTFSTTHINELSYHHERWDGRGYPDRLSGPAIPLVSRIIALADGYVEAVSREG